MPQVDVKLVINAPIDEIWAAVRDVESYPTYMDNVIDVRVDSPEPNGDRLSTWSVLLKGSVLEWTERERVDDAAHRIEFDQTDGDLDVFTGYWQLTETDGGVEAVLAVDFEIGLPLLADMLNPVAAQALSDNSEQMLREIERRVAAAA
jgi:ribosome-associated toxin RatA of RatAB toxin-antitoxin module